jgi:PAS domain S-box-containing protein
MNLKEKYRKLEERNIELEEKCNKLEEKLRKLSSEDMGNTTHLNDTVARVFHSADHLMVLIKSDTSVIVDVNRAFTETLGYSREEVIGHSPEELRLFADIEESNKYFRLLTRFGRINDYVISLRSREGNVRAFLFSADMVRLDDGYYLIARYNPIASDRQLRINESQGTVLAEIFDTISSYLALFSVEEDNRFYIADINSKAEEVEFVNREDIIGKCIDDTPLAKRIKLVELLNHVRITRNAHKLAASPRGDDSEGFYVGFLLTSGNIVISWEPGQQQKNIEDINRQSDLFRTFAEMMPGIIYEVGLDGRIIYGNRIGLEVFGYSPDDFASGIYIKDIFPDSHEQMMANLKALKSPYEVSSNEYLVKRKDGSTMPIVTHSFAVFHKGKKIGYRGTVTDLSRHKKYEEQIVREKAFLEHLIDSTPEAIAITDIAGKITMVNREFSDLFGYSYEEAVNNNIDDLVVPDEYREEAVTIEKLSSENRKVVKQTIRKDKNGNRFEVSLVATTITINNEPIANIGIYRNITTEKKNQLLQEILYNISSAALKQMDIKEIYPIIVQELSKIWDTNNFFIALYDQASDTMSLPFFADEKDKFYEIPTRGTISGYVIKNNKSVLLKEDDLKILEEAKEIELVGTPCKVWMGVPLKVENSIIGVMCLQDYNDEDKFTNDDLYVLDFIANQIAIAIQRRIMLDNLIAARQRAEEAAQAKQIFMSTMSHEIRTPLNEVIGITNLLLQGNPREDQMDYIRTLRFSGNHLLTLVNDVLDYNKMESGKIVFEQIQFNLNDFLDELMRSYSFRSKAKNLAFEIRREGNLPSEVIGDQIRLNQILSNLLSNALKFTSEGGITVTLKETERKKSKATIEFSVRDTGLGIPREKHGEIFESFTQASSDTARKFGGSGLGLAIVKKLVELQGGKITLESEPGVGSNFRFTLTFTVSSAGAKEHLTETPESFKGLEGKRILVAEDNKINFFVANKFLTGWGVIVTHAENGQLVLDKLEEESFDLILMDLHMPVMDGIEATRIIRKSNDQKIRNIPIVALTAAIMSESHDKMEEGNINDYVLKPFKPYDLFSKILKHVR